MSKKSKFKNLRKLNWLSGLMICRDIDDRFVFNYSMVINPYEKEIYHGLVNRLYKVVPYADLTIHDYIYHNVGQVYLDRKHIVNFKFPFSREVNLQLKFEKHKRSYRLKLTDGLIEFIYEPEDLVEDLVTKMESYRLDWEVQCPRAYKHLAEQRKKYPDILI